MEKEITLTPDQIFAMFNCPKCGVANSQALSRMSFTGDSQDCELCGSHGGVDVRITCGKCTHNFKVEITNW
jgi:predicted RNA-binding Zn-ribbon protein involved in translation (DUF1610 family)